ncbi:MAG: hypothetical protein M3P39_05200, partial [Actinomycetota bacterium]|nr:hypothetical protein [Actinomycetota bacterium]
MVHAPILAAAMRCACIDIGTNTTRLLVAEPGPDGRPREVLARRAFARLRRRADGTLPGDQVDALAGVVDDHARLAREAGAGT